MDGVVAGESGKRTSEANVLRRSGSLELLGAGLAGSSVGADVQAAAAVKDTVGASAGGDGVVESVLVLPALEVIGVQGVAGGITSGVDESVEVLD